MTQIYEGQLAAVEKYLSGALNTEAFSDAFWHARFEEVGPGKRASIWLDAILDPVSEILMGYEDDVPPVPDEEVMAVATSAWESYVAHRTK